MNAWNGRSRLSKTCQSTWQKLKSLAQEQEESQDNFQYLRRAHSAVEANINQLEHNGVNRCPDRGVKNFRRYVALGVLAYNLHHLGKLVIEAEKEMLLQKQPEALTAQNNEQYKGGRMSRPK